MSGTSGTPDRRPPGPPGAGPGRLRLRLWPILLLALAVGAGTVAAVQVAGPARPPAAAPATTARPATTRAAPATTTTTAPAGGVPRSARECLARPRTIRPDVPATAQYRVDVPVAGATYDLRGVVSTAYPGTRYPLVFGKVRHGKAVH
jgi:hypothetical protein